MKTLSIQKSLKFNIRERINHTVQTFNDLNSLPNNKILDQPKFKEHADDKIIATHKVKFVL